MFTLTLNICLCNDRTLSCKELASENLDSQMENSLVARRVNRKLRTENREQRVSPFYTRAQAISEKDFIMSYETKERKYSTSYDAIWY